MVKKILYKNIEPTKFSILLILLVSFFGIYLAFIGGYGSDEDTLPMISVFEQRLEAGRFISSRFTGNPIPELGIGFLAYNFGSWATNLSTFLFFIIGVIFFYLSFTKKKAKFDKNFLVFLLLCLSSPILFFDNIEPIDYSWAFLFYSLGLYFLSKNIKELAVLFFAFCIGSRINFVPFILIAYFFFNFEYRISFIEKLYNFIISFIIGGLFYLPIWYYSKFSLDWLTAARPLDQGYLGLLYRFLYKLNLTIGIFQSFLILFLVIVLVKNKKMSSYIKKNNFLILLILSNLLIFFYIPAELSYLQPAIIFFYFFIIKNFNQKIIYSFIVLNFISWFININYLEIKYEKDGICEPKNAIAARFNISLEQGYIEKYLNTRSMINCWIYTDDEKSRRIASGQALKE